MSKTIPPTCPEPAGQKYWRGLDELADTPEFRSWAEREFPAGASEFSDPVSRRNFVKIMSASFLLAGVGMGASGCRRPEEKILPFSRLPENYVHGVAQFYATAMPTRTGAIPLLAKSNEGRPTKVEGNPQHPDSNGGTDRFAQASILNLYDPDRAIRYAKAGGPTTKEAALDALAQLSKAAESNQGAGLCFLLERNTSPSRARLQAAIKAKFPQARWFVHEPVDSDIHRRAASLAFGRPVKPYFNFAKAKRIVSLDCDFIGAEENNHLFIRDFAAGRKVENPGEKNDTLISRLYAVESLMTLTGANADHRLRLASSQILSVAAALAAAVDVTGSADFTALLGQLPKLSDAAAKWVKECANDLRTHSGSSLVVAGQGQPMAVHLIVNAINFALSSVGSTVVLHEAPDAGEGSLADLVTALNAGQVASLVILGGNPAYNAPVDFNFAAALAKTKSVVRLGYYEDETFAAATRADDWHLPLCHYLESWGDARSSDGTVVSVQPLIAPLFSGLTEIEVLARIGGTGTTNPYEIVRDTFMASAAKWEAEESWKNFLHDGFVAGSAAKPAAVSINWGNINEGLKAAKPVSVPSSSALEVVFYRDSKVDDGRYNNNGWLQELPDPITKIVWENVFLVSAATFKALGYTKKDNESGHAFVPWVKLELNGRSVEGPAWIQPGQADNTVGVALGYGRSKSGRVGNGTGFNAYALRTSDAPGFAPGGKLSAPGKEYPVSTTQSHWGMEGRPVVREANLQTYLDNPGFAEGMAMPEPPGGDHPLYPNPLDIKDANGVAPRDKSPHAWGMAIDLNMCVGCSACVVACQSENNVPIVGKDLVGKSREMHWLRIDRYFTGGVDDPQVVNQPMLCQHCESAPCESVCPVNATMHDEEGLNVMAYNRCVGTRYCSNNCPYKVRRFNYLDYNKRPLDKLKGPVFSTPLLNTTPEGDWELARWWKNPYRGIRPQDEYELVKLAKNPDVTVRMRGVMEKCTFCIQRIEGAKIAQKVKAGATDDVTVKDGAFTTACAQACPAQAIVFGNVKDPDSRVSKVKASQRDYSVLEFLLTKPRLTYLARVRNPNPAMPDYAAQPASLAEWEAKGNHLEKHEEPAERAGTAEKGAH